MRRETNRRLTAALGGRGRRRFVEAAQCFGGSQADVGRLLLVGQLLDGLAKLRAIGLREDSVEGHAACNPFSTINDV